MQKTRSDKVMEGSLDILMGDWNMDGYSKQQ